MFIFVLCYLLFLILLIYVFHTIKKGYFYKIIHNFSFFIFKYPRIFLPKLVVSMFSFKIVIRQILLTQKKNKLHPKMTNIPFKLCKLSLHSI